MSNAGTSTRATLLLDPDPAAAATTRYRLRLAQAVDCRSLDAASPSPHASADTPNLIASNI
jgi:hypothetical protein